ncbi:MAG: zinc ribbon domain-containing protein [Anaerolineae bacterium]|nr:zinc ribbon domain-containing protein [Anaerolineae bacterium]
MPVYEYQCKTCGVRFERTQSFKDAPIKVCPECGGETHRVIGATGIIFKGSGFYINDSKSKSVSSSPAKAEKSESKTEGASETKSETKTESKSESSTASTTSTSSTSTAAT